MDEKEILTKKFTIVGMKQVDVSTLEKPIIGVDGLGPCVGFILYNREHKKAVVGHVALGQLLYDERVKEFFLGIYAILVEEQLLNSSFDLALIEGADESKHEFYFYDLKILNDSKQIKHNLLDVLEIGFRKLELINISSVTKFETDYISCDIQLDESDNIKSKRFAFDASSGEFVTDKVYFGKDYYRINSNGISK